MRTSVKQFFKFIKERSVEIIGEASLRRKLASRRILRVKLGIDPTSPDLHLGHVVPLQLLRAFQDAGHQAVIIIGDFTAQVGDASGREAARRRLSEKEVKENRRTYLNQIGRILDLKAAEAHYNSEWFSRMKLNEFLNLLTKFSLKSAWERQDFQRRLRLGRPVQLHEAMYHVLQGYDSVVVKADVEIGAVEQKLNILAGRELQRKLGYQPQDVVLLPYLVGLDGKQKMSKSIGNTINLRDTAGEMFGKTMTIPDITIINYAEFAAWLASNAVERLKRRLVRGENPRDVKLEVAEAIVARYHGKKQACNAREEFLRVFSRKERPTTIPDVVVKTGARPPTLLLTEIKAAGSNSEARRLLKGGAVEVDGKIVTPGQRVVTIRRGSVIRVGKKKFFRAA